MQAFEVAAWQILAVVARVELHAGVVGRIGEALLGLRVALLRGEDELAQGTVTLRDMLIKEQTSIPRDNAARTIRELLDT